MLVFTIGDVAKHCKVAPYTVKKWCDSHGLKYYRVPGSQDRRVARGRLYDFLKQHNMLACMPWVEFIKVLLVTPELALAAQFSTYFADDLNIRVVFSQNVFDAGINMTGAPTDCLIIDDVLGTRYVKALSDAAKRVNKKTVIITLTDGATTCPRLKYREVFQRPFDPQLLAQRVRTLLK